MTIFELARELGKALKTDEKLIRFEAAKKAYTDDLELQKMGLEYEVQQKALQYEMTKPERDEQLCLDIQKRIDELYNAIMTSPAYIELEKAQTEVNELMNAVNNTISFEITGEVPSCTHDCSTCGGGCSH